MLKNIIYINIAIAMVTSCGYSGSSENLKVSLIPFQEKEQGRWGFIDLEGNVKIKPSFKEQPTLFKEGFSLIQMKRKENRFYDFIDSEGKELDQKYVEALLFSEGLACVVKENKNPSYVNSEMETVFTLSDAEKAGVFSEGLAKFQNNKQKWGFVDKTGEVVIKPKYHSVKSFKEGLALVTLMTDDNNILRGFINNTGSEVIKINDKFTNLQSFNDGLAPYSDGDGWGYIDQTGEKIINAQEYRDEVVGFNNGFASYKEPDGTWGLINKEGEKVIRAKYNNPLIFINGLAAVVDDGKLGFINIDGDKKIDNSFDGLGLPFLGSNAIVKDGKYYIFIDENGEQINKNEVIGIGNYFNGLVNNNYDIIDINANINNYYNTIDINKTVSSDYFNIDAIVSIFDFEKPEGFSKGTRFLNVMNKYKLKKEDFKSWKSNKKIINNKRIDKNTSYDFFVLGKPYKSKFVKKDWYGSPVYKQSFSDTIKVVNYQYQIKLSNKGIGKEDEIISKIGSKLTGFKQSVKGKVHSFFNENLSVKITKKRNKVNVNIKFITEKEYQILLKIIK
jgi:hypothetical protein